MHIYIFFKLVKLVGRGSFINWAYPVVFISVLNNKGSRSWLLRMGLHEVPHDPGPLDVPDQEELCAWPGGLYDSMYLARRTLGLYVPDQEDSMTICTWLGGLYDSMYLTRRTLWLYVPDQEDYMYLTRRTLGLYVPDQEDFHISLLLPDSPVRPEGIVVAVGGVTVNHLWQCLIYGQCYSVTVWQCYSMIVTVWKLYSVTTCDSV